MDPLANQRDVLERALLALERTTGVSGQVIQWESSAPGMDSWWSPDAQIALRTPAGDRYEYSVEIKDRVDRIATLAQVRNRAEYASLARLNVLLVTAHLTATLLDACRLQLDLQAIDLAGNAYLRRPGLYVCSRGARPEPSSVRAMSGNVGGTAWLRVVYALLTDSDLARASYREIANASGVALGTVSSVLRDLENRQLLVSTPQGRHLVEPKRIVQEWVAQYPTRLRPKLHPKLLRVENPDWWRTAVLPDGAYWGGDVAAARLTDYLKPVETTVYVDPARRDEVLAQLVRQSPMRADKAGNLEVLDLPIPRECAGSARGIVHPLIVYADLLSTVDPRHREVAEMIRGRHLHELLGS
jgi:hypothetical protein